MTNRVFRKISFKVYPEKEDFNYELCFFSLLQICNSKILFLLSSDTLDCHDLQRVKNRKSQLEPMREQGEGEMVCWRECLVKALNRFSGSSLFFSTLPTSSSLARTFSTALANSFSTSHTDSVPNTHKVIQLGTDAWTTVTY